jgi:hypothetical protein
MKTIMYINKNTLFIRKIKTSVRVSPLEFRVILYSRCIPTWRYIKGTSKVSSLAILVLPNELVSQDIVLYK